MTDETPKRGRGRPPLSPEQRPVKMTMTFSPDVLAGLRARGPGWMPWANEQLREALSNDVLPGVVQVGIVPD